MRKGSPSPRFLVMLLGCVLVVLGTARTLLSTGTRGLVGLALLVAATAVIGTLYGVRLIDGEATVRDAPTRRSGVTDSTVSPQTFPPGTIESVLDALRDAWGAGDDGVAYLYPLPGPTPDGARPDPPSFTPVCTLTNC